MKYYKILVLIICILVIQPVVAVETGIALKVDSIRMEPFSDARAVAILNTGDKVTILKKDGGWLNIKSAKGNGWIRMLSIRRGEVQKSKGVVDSLQGLASGRSGTGRVVATTGIRGLNEEELRAAKFDAVELYLAESYSTSREDAQRFANQGKLKPRSFDYLPVPQ